MADKISLTAEISRKVCVLILFRAVIEVSLPEQSLRHLSYLLPASNQTFNLKGGTALQLAQ